ncbi:MAG: hypothetical protein QGG53_16490 [Planctomycetota bacterium]|nr:hypothetical protein [Planctomycetota bacterium]
MPRSELYWPLSTSVRFLIPGPLSETTIRNICGSFVPSNRNSMLPPPPYMKALRATSETAVAIRV